jgi:hypothetical protein
VVFKKEMDLCGVLLKKEMDFKVQDKIVIPHVKSSWGYLL